MAYKTRQWSDGEVLDAIKMNDLESRIAAGIDASSGLAVYKTISNMSIDCDTDVFNHVYKTSSGMELRIFEITPNKTYKIFGGASTVVTATSIDNIINGNTPSFTSDRAGAYVFSSNGTVFSKDTNAKYLILSGVGVSACRVYEYDVLEGKIENTSVAGLYISNTSKFASESISEVMVFPIEGGATYNIYCVVGKQIVVCPTTSADNIVANNAPTFATGYSARLVAAKNEVISLKAPEDAKYLLFSNHQKAQTVTVYKDMGVADPKPAPEVSGGKVYKERPATGVVNFTVDVDTYIPDVDSVTTKLQDYNPANRSSYIKKDVGILKLPVNYSASGKPVRMIIACHGAGTFITSTTTNVLSYGGGENYWLGEGYALMDVNGTPGADDVADNKDRHFGTPVTLRSYLAAYHYCIENYNIYPEVFLFGISMGGISSTMVSELGNIPVLAQAAFCPVLDLFKEVLGYSWGVHTAAYKKEAVTAKMNLNKGTKPTSWTTPGTDGAPMPANEREFFIANKEAFIGWNHMWRNVIGLDIDAYMALEESPKRTDINTEACKAEADLFKNAYKFREVPMKIWHATNDATVPWRYSKYYTDMCRRAGCLVELRTIPTGSHIFWDAMDSLTVTTPLGGNATTKVAFVEVLNYFKRFE